MATREDMTRLDLRRSPPNILGASRFTYAFLWFLLSLEGGETAVAFGFPPEISKSAQTVRDGEGGAVEYDA